MRWFYRLRVWFKLRLRSVMLIGTFCKECGEVRLPVVWRLVPLDEEA